MSGLTTITLLLVPHLPHRKVEYIRWKTKQILAYFYLSRLKKSIGLPFGFDTKASIQNLSGSGIIAPPGGWLRELPRQLSNDSDATDSISFWGLNDEGAVLITRLARRQGRTAEVWVYLRLATGEEYQLPNQPNSLVYNTNDQEFTAAGLTFEVLEPLRCWRVNFNGLLRKGVNTSWNPGYSDTIRVRFYFIWQPIYGYTAYPVDFNVSLMSKVIADETWTDGIHNSVHIKKSNLEWHEQWGQLFGTLNIGNNEETVLRLRGTKKRTYGVQRWNSIDKFVQIKGIQPTGEAYAFYGESSDKNPIKFYHGQTIHQSGEIFDPVSQCEITADDDKETNGNFTLQFTCKGKKHELHVKNTNNLFNAFVGESWDCEIQSKSAVVSLDGKPGIALITCGRTYFGGCPLPKRTSNQQLTEPDLKVKEHAALVVTFKDRECQCSKLVGGKGASLALMSSLQDNNNDFKIPNGVCVTRNGFDLYLKENDKIKEAVERLQAVAWKKVEGRLEDECKKVTACMISQQSIPQPLKEALSKQFENELGPGFEGKQFAVRSSAIGEDSKELSAAGQNDTFLGVKGYDKIVTSIIKCWASQFSFRSVEYKRQNGQLINGGMGIVIQEMIPSDVAGILFSKDPLTGCSDTITITANYGLGESVVSAATDPDTIELRREWDDTLAIQSKQVGQKTLKIVMDDEHGGTREKETELTESAQCVLSDKAAIQLGEIAIYLERCFGDARDIEWAIHKGQLYILQSRPVTSDVVLTDFEVLHELDTAPRTDCEYFSTGNVAEVMPGAGSHLSITGIFRAHTCAFYKMLTPYKCRYDPTYAPGFSYFYGHFFFDMMQQKAFALEKTKSKMAKALDIAIYGRALDDDEVLRRALERFEKPPIKIRLIFYFATVYAVLMGKRWLRQGEQKFRKYPSPGIRATSPNESFKEISLVFGDFPEAFLIHMGITIASTISNSVLLCILSGESKEFTTDHYADFATLIGNTNGAESGDVPISIKKLALVIAKEIDQNKFVEMSTEDALQWLKSGSSESSKKFDEFLENHGHRCYSELEVKSVSWGMDPKKVVTILQDTLKSPVKQIELESKRNSHQSPLDEIKTPVTGFRRRILKWVMSYSRTAMMGREQAKSLLVKYVDGMRGGYRHLATLMQHEGYIPDPELLFFFTNEEVGHFLDTRSPRILMRAKRRCQLYPYMDKLTFPESCIGYPKPDNIREKWEELDLVSQIKGYPVCQGVVKGTARVIYSYEEVNTIQKGDILITRATDIGWSPYFPMLSGVVTEIGGLISHGAVVAREYNLPCIVAAANATQVFKSGETVVLNATEGTITKVASCTDTK